MNQRRGLWLIFTVMAIVIVVGFSGLALFGYFMFKSLGIESIGFPEQEFAELEAHYGQAAEELQARADAARQRQRDELAAARAALPENAAIPRDWDFSQALRDAWLPVEEPTLCAMLGFVGGDSPAGTLTEEEWEDLSARLGPLQKAGKATPLEAQFDPTSQSREVVLEHFRDYVLNAPFLDQLEAAIDVGLCRLIIPPDMEETQAAELLSRRDVAVGLLRCRVIARGKQGDAAGALTTLNHLCTFTDVCEADWEPRMGFWRLSVSSEIGDVVRPALYLSRKGLLDASSKQRVLDYARKHRDHEVLAGSLRLLALSSSPVAPALDFVKQDERYPRLRTYRALQATDEYVSLLGRPYYEIAEELDVLDQKYTPAFFRDDDPVSFADAFKMGMDMKNRGDMGLGLMFFCDDLEHALWIHASDALMGDVAMIAFALAEYKSANGRYPKSLDELVPAAIAAIPTDPVSGEVLGYRLDGEGYELLVRSRSKSATEPSVFWRMAE